jgi:cysteine desulfurase
MKFPIYLDYAATTPVDPRVVAKMQSCLDSNKMVGNAASITHPYGLAAKVLIEEARANVAKLINATPEEIIWTSGATEAINLAIKGAAFFYQDKGKHIITCTTEHKAVLDTCRYLEKKGFRVTYLKPQRNGLLDSQEIQAAIQPETILLSIMQVNNEIGVIQDIQKISELCQKHNILFHVDAAQSAGKIAIDLQTTPIDLLSLSAHKLYGPPGIGALFVRTKPRVRLEPLIHGGGHEQGLRSGTLATHQIVAMGEAFAIAQQELATEPLRIKKLRDRLWDKVKTVDGVTLHGEPTQRVSGILNFSVANVDGEALIMSLPNLAIATSSACTAASIESSHVLRALGVKDDLAHSSLRISLGRFNTEEEIDYASTYIREKITWLRSLSPLEK